MKRVVQISSVYLIQSFKPQFNETILSLQYCKLSRTKSKSSEEWMGHVKFRANECNYKKHHSQLKEHFINGIHGEMMTAKIIKQLTMMQ